MYFAISEEALYISVQYISLSVENRYSKILYALCKKIYKLAIPLYGLHFMFAVIPQVQNELIVSF